MTGLGGPLRAVPPGAWEDRATVHTAGDKVTFRSRQVQTLAMKRSDRAQRPVPFSGAHARTPDEVCRKHPFRAWRAKGTQPAYGVAGPQTSAAKTCWATSSRQRHPGGLRRALADRDDAAVLAAHLDPLAGQQPADVSRLRASWSTWTGSPMRRTSTVAVVGRASSARRLRRRRGSPRWAPRRARRGPGSGCRRATRGGRRACARILRSTRSDMTCSQRHASSWTYSHSRPMTSTSSRSARRCLRMTRVAMQPAVVGELEVAVAREREQAVALHPGHGLRHGRARVAEALGDTGAQGDDPLLLELEDRLEVHLGGVDQVRHST